LIAKNPSVLAINGNFCGADPKNLGGNERKDCEFDIGKTDYCKAQSPFKWLLAPFSYILKPIPRKIKPPSSQGCMGV